MLLMSMPEVADEDVDEPLGAVIFSCLLWPVTIAFLFVDDEDDDDDS